MGTPIQVSEQLEQPIAGEPQPCRLVVLVVDGFGIGEAPDAADFDSLGANTLGNTAAAVGGLILPFLERAGLGRLTAATGLQPVPEPEAFVGRLVEHSAANDSPNGHWELFGVVTETAPPTYPDGFPDEVVSEFEKAIGRPVLCNRRMNGLDVLRMYGQVHLLSGQPILYTSGDSVFQLAVHTDVAPVAQLYGWCALARTILRGQHAVCRVIARPFTGSPGTFSRLPARRDWALPPPRPTGLRVLREQGHGVVGIGKIEDLFGAQELTRSFHPGDNAGVYQVLTDIMKRPPSNHEVIVANLVDTDTKYGHGRDPQGMARALSKLDSFLATTIPQLGSRAVFVVTGDHGNDPTWAHSTDHTRERVPLVAWVPGRQGRDIGTRAMADLGATVLSILGCQNPNDGAPIAEITDAAESANLCTLGHSALPVVDT